MKTWDFLPDFIKALREQLEEDDKKWGETWLHRTRKGQDERTVKSLRDKFDQFEFGKQRINWLKIAGEAFICWLREQREDIWPE